MKKNHNIQTKGNNNINVFDIAAAAKSAAAAKNHVLNLKRYRACQAAVEFATNYDTFKQVLNACDHYDWIRWALRLLPEKQRIKAACHIIRNTPTTVGTVWDMLTDERSRKAIEVAEVYADGRATREELAIAAATATAAAAADAAATAAAFAAAAAYAYASAAVAASADAAAAATATASAAAAASVTVTASAAAFAYASAATDADAAAGAEKWQMEYIRSLDWSFMDEEPPADLTNQSK